MLLKIGETQDAADDIYSSLLAAHENKQAQVLSYITSGACKYVYFDLGTNLGVQLRKLYQPNFFPNATALPVFDFYFGENITNRRSVCAIGFEPNPDLSDRLTKMQDKFQAKGFPVVIFTNTSVSTKTGIVDFSVPCDSTFAIGGRISIGTNSSTPTFSPASPASPAAEDISTSCNKIKKILSMDLAAFVQKLVNISKKQETASGSWIAKMDVEGEEYKLLPHMLQEHAPLCRLSTIMIEWYAHSVHV